MDFSDVFICMTLVVWTLIHVRERRVFHKQIITLLEKHEREENEQLLAYARSGFRLREVLSKYKNT